LAPIVPRVTRNASTSKTPCICQDHANLIIEQYIQEGMEFINENSNEEREEIQSVYKRSYIKSPVELEYMYLIFAAL
jgi:hypothetical protein